MARTGPKPGTKQTPEHIANRAAALMKYDRRARTMREYRAWCAIKTRCFNPRRMQWKDWGGRGITMCPEWRASFPAFLRDMGPCPAGTGIDRIDNDGDYEPGNCRWATPREQNRNSRNSARITFNGETHCITDWSRRLGLKHQTLSRRLQSGVPIARALDPTPLPPINKVRKQSPEHVAKRMASKMATIAARGYTVAR